MTEAPEGVLSPLINKTLTEAQKRAYLVKEIMSRHRFLTLEDTDEIYVYENGVYVPGGNKRIIADLQLIGGYEITNHIRKEVSSTIRAKTAIRREVFDSNPDIINLSNGLYNISNNVFQNHTPDYPSLIQLPLKFNPRATCKPIIEALYNTFHNPSDVPLFLEYLAYIIFERNNKDLQKELMLVGKPECGKSKNLDVLIALLGSKHVSAVTLQQLSTNRFAKAQLDGKLANIYADISHARIEDLENFKTIATADEIEAEKKGMQLYKFRPTVKFVYSTNSPPRPPIDVDDSFYRRWMIIQCAWRENDYFTGKPRVRDPDILKKLITEENLSGLLNLVIMSAKRLKKKGAFSKRQSTDEIRRIYEKLSNPVLWWVKECCEEIEGEHILKEEACKSYVRFCRNHELTLYNDVWMGRELAALGYTNRQTGTGTNKKWSISGLRLKENEGNK